MKQDCTALKQTSIPLPHRSALLAVLWYGCCAVSASAQSLTATYGGSPASVSFAIPVSASVTARCGFAEGAAPVGTFDAGAIDRTAWSNDFAFTLDCNGPSRIAIASRNAGLKNDLPQAVPGYANVAPYTVALSIASGAGVSEASCTAAQLAAPASSGSGSGCALAGTASATQGLLIPVATSGQPGSFMRVSAPAYAGADVLVSGTYADTLTVTIAPAS
jgi:hypothetical protein